jgi:hypothetical protein
MAEQATSSNTPEGPPAKRQKTSNTPSLQVPKIVDLTKNLGGNLVVSVGTGEDVTLIRIHGVMVKMASSVFGAMLGPHFAEGSTKFTDDNPLKLDEDEPQAMIDLLSLLHHSYTTMLPASRLPGVILAADKYDCIAALRPWFLIATGQYSVAGTQALTSPDDKGLSSIDTACIAYAIGDAKLFRAMTKRVIIDLAMDEVFDGQATIGLLEIVPGIFLGKSQIALDDIES